jgi:hypothetical protein
MLGPGFTFARIAVTLALPILVGLIAPFAMRLFARPA